MTEESKPECASSESEAHIRFGKKLALCRAALHRAARLVPAYRRHFRTGRYGLKEDDRMLAKCFNPAFCFSGDLPIGQKVLIVLPHHHEAAKIGGMVRMLMVRGADPRPKNRIRVVVVIPSHRSITAGDEFKKREDMIDAVRKEALDWACLIGLDLGMVLLPGAMAPHPSHRNTRSLAMEVLRRLLAERHANGDRRMVTLLEYASFHLVTPPRYNLWAVAPKNIAGTKTPANRVVTLQKRHGRELHRKYAPGCAQARRSPRPGKPRE